MKQNEQPACLETAGMRLQPVSVRHVLCTASPEEGRNEGATARESVGGTPRRRHRPGPAHVRGSSVITSATGLGRGRGADWSGCDPHRGTDGGHRILPQERSTFDGCEGRAAIPMGWVLPRVGTGPMGGEAHRTPGSGVRRWATPLGTYATWPGRSATVEAPCLAGGGTNERHRPGGIDRDRRNYHPRAVRGSDGIALGRLPFFRVNLKYLSIDCQDWGLIGMLRRPTTVTQALAMRN